MEHDPSFCFISSDHQHTRDTNCRDCGEKTDTTQNKPTCCEKCKNDKPLKPNSWHSLCPCHTQTTPSEEWERMFDERWEKQNDFDFGPEPIKAFIRNIKTAAYQKGVRDSLEVVERIESDPPSESIEETLAFQKACNEAIEAISTLLK